MHNSIILCLWASVSYVLYKIVATIINKRRHARNARKLGCGPAHNPNGWDLFGIVMIRNILQADKQARVPVFFNERFDIASVEQNRKISTTYTNSLGSDMFNTMDPKNIQAMLATQFKDFGLGMRRHGNFHPLLGNGIFSTDGKQWEHSRALLRPQFARDQVSDLDLEEEHVQNLMQAIPTNKDGWTETADLLPLFFRLTLDSATEFLFGESVDSQLSSLPGYTSNRPPMSVSEKEFALAFDSAQATIATAGRLGDAYWIAFNKKFKDDCARCHAFIDHYVQLALTKEKGSAQLTSAGKPRYIFLNAVAESTRDPIELREQMISILLAGRDTTAALLSFVFMVFTQRPEIYAKLRAIVLEQFGTFNNPHDITFANLKNCNYLQWVINEALRLHPVVPIDGRSALRDTTLPRGGGPDGTQPVYVRKGSEVLYSVFSMHRRTDLWGADAEEFKPERWDGRKSGWEYLPFNGGPRICIGQQFALTEAGYVLVRMCQRFEQVQGVGNSWEHPKDGGMGVIRYKLTLTNVPADGVKVRMKEASE